MFTVFSKLTASDDVPVCSRRSWPWRAGSHAGSLRLVVLVAFTNVIPTARRTSRLSDHWLLSRLWATTYHSERRRNNNYNINLLLRSSRDLDGSQGRATTRGWVWGLQTIPGLPIRCTPDRLNLSHQPRPTTHLESEGTRVFIAFWGRGHDVTTAHARAIITQARGTALTHGWVLFLAPSESLSTRPAGGATKERNCGGRPQLVPPWHIF